MSSLCAQCNRYIPCGLMKDKEIAYSKGGMCLVLITHKKCFALAINRSKGANLKKLRTMNNVEEVIQCDWEIWLKEKKALCLTISYFLDYRFTSLQQWKHEELSDENEDYDFNEPLVPKRL
ncbi:hypothetical protein Glove_543g81 [Diversispora epigaea]|uniref:Uncharacterized protein n=1 Tax=Diversispora epigaea TaxID=1348612 RepID=A0A397GEZ4_9GLOM|nr:hypothetical protein Glove_543g81 [Diversispora epigaea]